MDASRELLTAMLNALRSEPAVTSLVGNRIVDRPQGRDGKPAAGYPYISVGPSTGLPADADCIVAEELSLQLDVWTWGADSSFASSQCRELASAIKRVLHEAEFDLTDNALVTLTWELTRILDDPNPAIRHGAVQFTAIVETP